MVTRQQVVSEIQNGLQMRRMPVTRVVTIDEVLPSIKHACVNTGVTCLQQNTFNVPLDGGGMIPFPYYYCNQCGTLYVYSRLYD